MSLFCSNLLVAIEISSDFCYTVNVLAVIGPWGVAWAKLSNAASVLVNRRARRRVRALITFIGHTVAVAVNGCLGLDFDDPIIAIARTWAVGRMWRGGQ